MITDGRIVQFSMPGYCAVTNISWNNINSENLKTYIFLVVGKGAV